MTSFISSTTVPPKNMADAILNQATPTSAALYTILPTTLNCKIYSATVSVTWTVQPTPVEIIVTIDGNVITHAFTNPVSTTPYGICNGVVACNGAATAQLLAAAYAVDSLPPFYEGKSIMIQARTTGGTVSVLAGRVKYGQY
jgi:hypothetical protein